MSNRLYKKFLIDTWITPPWLDMIISLLLTASLSISLFSFYTIWLLPQQSYPNTKFMIITIFVLIVLVGTYKIIATIRQIKLFHDETLSLPRTKIKVSEIESITIYTKRNWLPPLNHIDIQLKNRKIYTTTIAEPFQLIADILQQKNDIRIVNNLSIKKETL